MGRLRRQNRGGVLTCPPWHEADRPAPCHRPICSNIAVRQVCLVPVWPMVRGRSIGSPDSAKPLWWRLRETGTYSVRSRLAWINSAIKMAAPKQALSGASQCAGVAADRPSGPRSRGRCGQAVSTRAAMSQGSVGLHRKPADAPRVLVCGARARRWPSAVPFR